MAKINDTYDIVAAIEAVENELTASMIRNMKRHKLEEIKEDKQWSMWQAEMLKSLEVYKKQNQKKYGTVFKNINAQISALIQAANEEGQMDQEKQILNAIRNGLKARHRISPGGTAEFFKVNDRKLEALIQATTHDMERAEVAILRRAEDQYRQVIYNAQVYANTGAGTYEKAVDMATKDFLRAGINCVQYANGARHTLKDYADMAIRTASKRAYLQGEGVKRQEWGLPLVIMNKRGNPCPLCLPFVGKILIDDVWSGGSSADGPYQLMSTAIKAGLYHPRCKDSHTTYFPGLSSVDARYNKKELAAVEKQAKEEARQQYAERQADAYGRMAEHSLDTDNKKTYGQKQRVYRENVEQTEQSLLRQNIAGIRQQYDTLEKSLAKAKEEEKALTQKVYFDATGTPEEIDRLRTVAVKRKQYESEMADVKEQLLQEQEKYKAKAEERLVKDKIVEKVKLSKKMTPESVDALESTLRALKDKYGIMPKGIVYSPLKVEDATATYDWMSDTIYLSNNFNDIDKYLKKVEKSEQSLIAYKEQNQTEKIMTERLKKAEAVLADKSTKGLSRELAEKKRFELEQARLAKTEAEIWLREKRMAVRENAQDCIIHEYGHFIHRHANANYGKQKDIFGMKELGGFYDGEWRYERNKVYSARGKVEAAGISRYAAKDPYETFAEGFLAMEKGEKIPDQIAEVIEEAKVRAGVKGIAKGDRSGILISGARITDPDGMAGTKFAEMYYEEIRKFSTDAEKIAGNLGKDKRDIQKIKAYLFEEESLVSPETGERRRFDPDCAIAQSWQRLMNGKDIKPHDRTLIEHELLEMKIKREHPEIDHIKAHKMAAEKYNYPKEAMEYYGSLKGHKKDSK